MSYTHFANDVFFSLLGLVSVVSLEPELGFGV